MEWSNETTMEFLSLYENEPAIWNASHPLHKNRNEVFDAWKRIQQKFSTDCTVVDLKKKKESLMARFRQCHAKVKQTLKSGAGAESVYKPIWFAYENMASFLKNKDEPRETINSVEIQSQLHSTNETEDDDDDNVDSETSHEPSHEQHENNDNLVLPNDSEKTIHNEKSLQNGAKRRDIFKAPGHRVKKQTIRTYDTSKLETQMDDAYNILKASAHKKENCRDKDECDIYGELLASKLRKLDEVTRDYVMNQIDNFIFTAKKSANFTYGPPQLQNNNNMQVFPHNNINPGNSLHIQYPTENQQFSSSQLPQQNAPPLSSTSRWVPSPHYQEILSAGVQPSTTATPLPSPSQSSSDSAKSCYENFTPY